MICLASTGLDAVHTGCSTGSMRTPRPFTSHTSIIAPTSIDPAEEGSQSLGGLLQPASPRRRMASVLALAQELIIPAPTVLPVASSIRMNEPVARLVE